VLRPGDATAKRLAYQFILQRIVAVPRQGRRRGHRMRRKAVRQMSLDIRLAGYRDVAHHTQRLHSAAGHRCALRGHRTHHNALAQQPGRVVLILDPDIEQHVVQCGEDAGEPRRHRIGVDRQRNSR
jgi:hypothetical protein